MANELRRALERFTADEVTEARARRWRVIRTELLDALVAHEVAVIENDAEDATEYERKAINHLHTLERIEASLPEEVKERLLTGRE